MRKDMLKTVLADAYENRWICLGVRPAYRYEGNARTEEVVGVYYRCLHPQAPEEGHIDIKVLGQDLVVSPEEVGLTCELSFDGLEFVIWTDRKSGGRRTSGKAVRATRV